MIKQFIEYDCYAVTLGGGGRYSLELVIFVKCYNGIKSSFFSFFDMSACDVNKTVIPEDSLSDSLILTNTRCFH